jgi:hypothetical protein
MLQRRCRKSQHDSWQASFDEFCRDLGMEPWKYLHMAGHGNLPFIRGPGVPPEYTFCFIRNDNLINNGVEAATDPHTIAAQISRFGADSALYQVADAETRGNLKLVFLNGCKTELVGSAIHGVRYVIYWETIVENKAAMFFAKEFYMRLGGDEWDNNDDAVNANVVGAFDRAYRAFRTHHITFADRPVGQRLHLGDPQAKDEANGEHLFNRNAAGQQTTEVYVVHVTGGVQVHGPLPPILPTATRVQVLTGLGVLAGHPQLATIIGPSAGDQRFRDLVLHDAHGEGTRWNNCRWRNAFHGKPRMRVATPNELAAAAADGEGGPLLAAVWAPVYTLVPPAPAAVVAA